MAFHVFFACFGVVTGENGIKLDGKLVEIGGFYGSAVIRTIATIVSTQPFCWKRAW